MLPKDLCEQSLWTLSDTREKKPVDLETLARSGQLIGWSPAQGHLLYPYETVARVWQAYPNYQTFLKPAYRLTNQSDYFVVDIEPKGRSNSNPYLNYPYVYLEESQHGGLHGLLPLHDSGLNLTYAVVKDHENESEFLLNKHFITFTGKVHPELIVKDPDPQHVWLKQLTTLLKQLHPKDSMTQNASFIPNTGLTKLANRPLTVSDFLIVYSLELASKHFATTDDKSVRVYTWTTETAKLIYEKLTKSDRTPEYMMALVRFYADLTYPKRRKDNRYLHSHGYAPTTWLNWTIWQAITHVVADQQ